MSTPAGKGGQAPPPRGLTQEEIDAAMAEAEAEGLVERVPAAETPAEAIPADEAEATGPPPNEPETPAEPPRDRSRRALPVRRAQALQLGPQRDLSLDDLRTLGWWLSLSESGAQDEKARGAAGALRLYYVQQLGLPLWSVRELSLISGKLVVSSRLLRALANRAGLVIERVDASDESCTAVLIRAGTGEQLGSSTFTIEEAKRAGLIRAGSAWTTYPARMLWARASAHVLTDYAPEIVLGMQTEDEAREVYALEPEPIGIDRGYSYGDPDDEDIPF